MATKVKLVHRETGLEKTGFFGFSWTTLFFGMFPALFRGDFLTFVGGFAVLFIVSLATAGIGTGIAMIVWAFLYNKYYTRKLLEKGYVFADTDEMNARAASELGVAGNHRSEDSRTAAANRVDNKQQPDEDEGVPVVEKSDSARAPGEPGHQATARTRSSQANYKVIMRGTRSGLELDEVADKLAGLFKISSKKALSILSTPGFVIKSAIDFQTAEKYRAALARCGCECVAEPEVAKEETLAIDPPIYPDAVATRHARMAEPNRSGNTGTDGAQPAVGARPIGFIPIAIVIFLIVGSAGYFGYSKIKLEEQKAAQLVAEQERKIAEERERITREAEEKARLQVAKAQAEAEAARLKMLEQQRIAQEQKRVQDAEERARTKAQEDMQRQMREAEERGRRQAIAENTQTVSSAQTTRATPSAPRDQYQTSSSNASPSEPDPDRIFRMMGSMIKEMQAQDSQ